MARDITPWDEVEVFDWTDVSGELGDRLYKVRRVRTRPHAHLLMVEGLIRQDWFNPDESGTDYIWEWFDFVPLK